jgi:hypothetical protein
LIDLHVILTMVDLAIAIKINQVVTRLPLAHLATTMQEVEVAGSIALDQALAQDHQEVATGN